MMAARTSRLPLVLLAFTTILAFGGPFLIWMVIRGGPQREWPPDRPIEWIVLLLVLGLFPALLVACVGAAAFQLRRLKDQDSRRLDENDLHLTDADAPATDIAGPDDLHLDRPGHPRDENDLRL